MNFNADEKNEKQLDIDKNPIRVAISQGSNKKVDSPEGSKASILSIVSAVIAIIILFVGAPLISRKSGSYISGSSIGDYVDLMKRKSFTIYGDDQLLLVAIIITIFTIIAAVIAILRKNREPNFLDILGIGCHILNCVAIIITASIAFFDRTKVTAGGGISVTQGTSQQPTFWFVLIALLLVSGVVLSISSYKFRKNA